MSATDPDITFICIASTDTPAKTFLAVRTADREAVVNDMFTAPGMELWFVDFPDLVELAADELAGRTKAVVRLGTAVDGEWTSWHPPVPAPAVPTVT